MPRTTYFRDELSSLLNGNKTLNYVDLYLALLVGTRSQMPRLDGNPEREPVAPGYLREKIDFTPPSGGRITQANNLDFGKATAEWGNISHFAIATTSTPLSGKFLFVSSFDSALVAAGTNYAFRISKGTHVYFRPGAIYIDI
jgi:hypothetical protein